MCDFVNQNKLAFQVRRNGRGNFYLHPSTSGVLTACHAGYPTYCIHSHLVIQMVLATSGNGRSAV